MIYSVMEIFTILCDYFKQDFDDTQAARQIQGEDIS